MTEWKRFTVHTTEEAEEAVSEILYDMGYSSLEIEDSRPVSPEESGGLFGDVVPEMTEDDHRAAVSFYTEADADSSEIIGNLSERLGELKSRMDIGSGEITESVTREEDWINNWKDYFHSFRIDDIYIRPSWEDEGAVPDDVSMVLEIDPGTAFGTGAHESTQLAVRALRKYIREGDSFLDIGTGSGILGIVALKSGASSVFGTDIDSNTLPAIEANLKGNGIEDGTFVRVLGNIVDDPKIKEAAGFEKYDVAAANIIAEILAEVVPELPAHLVSGGYIITSGIIEGREDIVIKAAEAAGLHVVEITRQGEWASIVFRKA
ncbi:MAG: 50S ribosomal protein L11 methyltransferase [Lachnospiraceae bacterium]|nr:50S ribosomal protein L11 methyltransferase [Lachnospiraceae bacterium]